MPPAERRLRGTQPLPTPPILRLLATAAVIVSAASLASPAASDPAKPEAARGAPAFAIDDVLVAPSPSGPSLYGVLVHIELLSAEAQASLNGQSASVTLDDDCDGHQVKLRRVLVFRDARQAGTPSDASAPANWLPFSSHSYAAQIAEAICAKRADLAAAVPSASNAPPPPVGSPIQLAEARLLPAADPQTSTPPPGATPSPPPPAPASASRVSSSARADAAPPTSAPTSALSTAPTGRIQVQYLSTTSEAELQQATDKLREKLGAEAGRLSFSTAHAVVRGVSRFRGRIGPFASGREATAFCVTVKRSGFSCLPVPDGGGR